MSNAGLPFGKNSISKELNILYIIKLPRINKHTILKLNIFFISFKTILNLLSPYLMFSLLTLFTHNAPITNTITLHIIKVMIS